VPYILSYIFLTEMIPQTMTSKPIAVLVCIIVVFLYFLCMVNYVTEEVYFAMFIWSHLTGVGTGLFWGPRTDTSPRLC